MHDPHETKPENFLHELERSRESLNFVLQSVGMGTWDIDLTTNTVQCSSAHLELWEISQEEFNGDRNLLQRKVHPDDLEKMRAAIDTAIKTESIYDHEYRLLLRSGAIRWVRSRGRVTYSPEKLPMRFSGIVFDITSQREKEEALALAMKDRERFLIVAGHELRTPLTGLQLQLQVMEGELQEKFSETLKDERLSSSISRQKEQIWRLVRIIDNICEHSQISEESFELRLETLDLVTIVESLIQRFTTLASANHGVNFSFTSSVDSLMGQWDRHRIENAVLNLMSNAIRFGNRGLISVEISRNGSDAHICVRDNGPGLNQVDVEKIFERNISGSSDSGGMGLGLHITHRIVHSHGGKMQVKSKPGKGSEFTIILPCPSLNSR